VLLGLTGPGCRWDRGSLVAVNSVDTRICAFRLSQHVVERAVFHHQHNDVLEIVETSGITSKFKNWSG